MQALLQIKNLAVSYYGLPILEDVDLSIGQGEIIGIVGESGCGKSTLIRAVMGLLGSGGKINSGSIIFDETDMLEISKEKVRRLRGSKLGMIFQNPEMSFNPIRKFQAQFLEAMRSHGKINKKEAIEQIMSLFLKLNLQDGMQILNSYPFELSGGMNQRVAIALAMVLKPKLLLADEPTSALDVTVQAQAVKEIMHLRDACGTSILMVTHNIGVVSHIADKVAVMYAGRVVEFGDKHDVLLQPKHPYTQALIASIPQIGGGIPKGITGCPPIFGEKLAGCGFAPRCDLYDKEYCCNKPDVKVYGNGHWALCGKL